MAEPLLLEAYRRGTSTGSGMGAKSAKAKNMPNYFML
jgi:hypothetical protein